jgi:hypothetical protein
MHGNKKVDRGIPAGYLLTDKRGADRNKQPVNPSMDGSQFPELS